MSNGAAIVENWQFLRKLNMNYHMTQPQFNPCFRYVAEIESRDSNKCLTAVFIAAFTVSRRWKQPRCLGSGYVNIITYCVCIKNEKFKIVNFMLYCIYHNLKNLIEIMWEQDQTICCCSAFRVACLTLSVQLFVTLWIGSRRLLCPLNFPEQNIGVGLPVAPLRITDPGIKPHLLCLLHWGGFFTHRPWEAPSKVEGHVNETVVK